LYQDSSGATPVASDGDPIGLANNKSSVNADAKQDTTAAKPTWKLNVQNGLAVARFDGGDTLSFPVVGNLCAALDPADFSVFVVCAAASGSGLRFSFGSRYTVGPGARVYLGNADTEIYAQVGNPASVDFETASLTYFQFYIHCLTDVSGANATSFVNGGVGESAAFTNAPLVSFVNIGSYEGTSNFYLGDIGEVLVYTSLSADDIVKVTGYLAKKWGITLT